MLDQATCAFHPSLEIANFCRNPECLLPMCSKCVKIHSLEHKKSNTYGNFDNIFDLYAEVEGELQSNLVSLIDGGECLKKIFQEQQKNKQEIFTKLKEIKPKILEGVSKYIDGI